MPDSSVGSFYSKIHLFVHLFNNLNYGGSKHCNLKSASRTKRKNKTRSEPRKHTKYHTLAPLIFSPTRIFFRNFLDCTKGYPSFLWIFCNTMDVKLPKGSPFYIFDTVTLFKNHFFQKFFGKFFKVTKGCPFNFFRILQPAGDSQYPKDPPFHNFEPQILRRLWPFSAYLYWFQGRLSNIPAFHLLNRERYCQHTVPAALFSAQRIS